MEKEEVECLLESTNPRNLWLLSTAQALHLNRWHRKYILNFESLLDAFSYFSTQVRPQPSAGQMRAPPKEKKTKDDAYADFMKEMQDLL